MVNHPGISYGANVRSKLRTSLELFFWSYFGSNLNTFPELFFGAFFGAIKIGRIHYLPRFDQTGRSEGGFIPSSSLSPAVDLCLGRRETTPTFIILLLPTSLVSAV